jgi:predicted regulator of Ras-like GTPase activity (Roadblock/LC7/MglB family)
MTYPATPVPTGPATTTADVAWLLSQFASEAPGVTHAVILSLDGLRVAAAGAVDRDLADQLAACTSGLLSLAHQLGSLLASGSPDHVTVRFGQGHLLCMRIGQLAGLMVAAAPDSDLRVLAFQMTRFVQSVGHRLAPAARATPASR